MTHFEKIARIDKTFLGFEDHGIFTATLSLDYGGSGQGTPGYALAAHAHDFIVGILRATGVDSWEKVQGRTVLALLDSDSWDANVVGLRPLPTEHGDTFVFADVWPAKKVAS